jgi:glucosyl-dolichyl phosphate glucuronosyltransferase
MALRSIPSVSVIIPAYTMDRWTLLEEAVVSARRQTTPPIEVIVCIDNNDVLFQAACDAWCSNPSPSAEVPVRVVPSDFSHDEDRLSVHIQAHGSKRRFGAGQARNTAAAQAKGEILAFLDDDAAAEPDWLEQLVKPFSDPKVLAVGGAPHPRYETDRPRWFPSQFDWVFGCAYEGLPTTAGPLIRLIGANMSVRAATLDQIGGFHSIDFDDMDMCHRVAELGGPGSVFYTPIAVVHHFVPEHRTSWRYFWHRCFYVNRHKMEAHREMGTASTFGPELAFVIRTLTAGVGREVKALVRGDADAGLRIMAILVGLTCAAVGNAFGRVDGLVGSVSPAQG